MAKRKPVEVLTLDLMESDLTPKDQITEPMQIVARRKQEIAPGAQCIHCPLLSRPLVPGFGTAPDSSVCRGVIVGEAPGRNEAKQGVPFIGDSGKLLKAMIRGFTDIDPEDLYLTNTALCHPPSNKIPWKAAQCCRLRLLRELEPYLNDPDIPIMAAGAVAAKVLTGIMEGSLRGTWQNEGSIVCTWHPAYVLRTGEHFSELRHDLQKFAQGYPTTNLEVSYSIVQTPEQLDEWVDWLIEHRSGETVCFDLETDQLVYWEHKILCMGFAYTGTSAFVIPGYLIYLPSTKKALNRLFASKVLFMGHNIKFDIRFLRHQLGVNARAEDDSLVAHYVLDETMYHGLKPLLMNYLDIGDYEGELIKKYLKNKNSMYSEIPPEPLMKYNALDVCYNLRLWKILKAELKEEDLWHMPYRYPLMAAQPHLVDMELYGLHCDEPRLQEMSELMGEGAVQIQSQLEDMAMGEFNPNSWVQVQKIMYDFFSLPVVRGRKFKVKSTCAEARLLIRQRLVGLGKQDSTAYKWLEMFDQLKSLLKLKSSYIDNLFYRKRTKTRMIDPQGMIHPDCLLYGTETGRVSFRDPAIQTIPRPGTGNALGDTWGQHVRAAYCTAPKGWVIMEVDISQAEMRVACALSGDPYLHKIYCEDRDLHSEVAISMYGPDYTKDQRNYCKKFNFAFLYGGTEHSFAMETGMSMTLARQFVREYKELMTTLVAWREVQLDVLKTNGYVETLTKRRRRFPLITNDNVNEARKASLNMPVQGMASDVTLMTFISVSEWLKETGIGYAKVVAIIHDSVLLEVRNDKIEEVGRKVQHIMKTTGEKWVPQVPWKVDIDTGPDWGHLEGYDG